MKIAIVKETASGETRVAVVPETVKRLVDSGLEVVVEAGAGLGAMSDDAAYRSAGDEVIADAAAVWSAG
ncbi:hypothetical protein LCGC14_2037040, partial [marine sediment metagenome]